MKTTILSLLIVGSLSMGTMGTSMAATSPPASTEISETGPSNQPDPTATADPSPTPELTSPTEPDPTPTPELSPPTTPAPTTETEPPKTSPPSPAALVTTGPLPSGTFSARALNRGTARIGGTDRYQTSALLSQRLITTSKQAASIFVASGSSFADGLPLGALASYAGGSLLLTNRDYLPASVGDEIRRLAGPNVTVYIAGGTSTVSANVEAQINAIIGDTGSVERLAGGNRYETSLAIAKKFPKTGVAMLASGVSYPDALVASASSGKAGGAPIILTPGARLDGNALQALNLLLPKKVYLIGGVWSDQERARISSEGKVATVAALTGADRYKTSAAVAKNFWGATPTTIIYVSGTSYADAMTAGPAGKALGGPLLLSTANCRPKEIAAAGAAQGAVLILGGFNSLSDGVQGVTCPILPPMVFESQGFYRFGMGWVGQQNGYYCGPATGYMILSRLGYNRSASGVALSQYSLATDPYMATNSIGRTAWIYNKVSVGLNNWMGKSSYQQQGSPSADFFAAKVAASFQTTGRPVVVDTEELRYGTHYNNHPRSSAFSHLMPIEGYNPSTGKILMLDPAAHFYSGSQQLFSYDLRSFTQFLSPFGIYY